MLSYLGLSTHVWSVMHEHSKHKKNQNKQLLIASWVASPDIQCSYSVTALLTKQFTLATEFRNQGHLLFTANYD